MDSPGSSSPAPRRDRAEIVARLAAARRDLSQDLGQLSERLNVSRRIQTSFQRHPAWWIGGGLLAGWVVSKILSRPARPGAVVKNSLGKTVVLGLMGTVAKEIMLQFAPALQELAMKQWRAWSGQGTHPTDSDPSDFPPASPHG